MGHAEDRTDPGDANGEVVVLQESIAAARAGLNDEGGIAGEKLQERDQGVGVARIDLPSAAEPTDDQGGSGFTRSDVENGTSGGHEAVGLAGDYRAEGRRLLSNRSEERRIGKECRSRWSP